MAYETSLRPYFVRMLCNHVEIRLMREATAKTPWTPDAEITSGAYCRKCGGERDDVLHERDTMCCLDVTDPGVCPSCIICGVTFGDPCKSCRGRGFHFPGCETPTYDDKRIDPVKLSTEPSGECVAGCGEPAFAYGCAALKGYVDSCGACAPMVLKDAVAGQKEST